MKILWRPVEDDDDDAPLLPRATALARQFYRHRPSVRPRPSARWDIPSSPVRTHGDVGEGTSSHTEVQLGADPAVGTVSQQEPAFVDTEHGMVPLEVPLEQAARCPHCYQTLPASLNIDAPGTYSVQARSSAIDEPRLQSNPEEVEAPPDVFRASTPVIEGDIQAFDDDIIESCFVEEVPHVTFEASDDKESSEPGFMGTDDTYEEEWLDPNDVSFHPDQSSEGDRSVIFMEEPATGTADDTKYIVFESCLRQLFQRCPQCGTPGCDVTLRNFGTMVKATVTCSKQHVTLWSSQPMHHGKALGNILLCCAILFSCSSPTQALRMLQFMGVQSLQKTQYFEYQRFYMLPAVTEVWQSEQAMLLDKLRGQELCIAGDGRADSPGHSADFGTYSLLETGINRIIHVEIVKSTEVDSSNRMEREGLQRSLQYVFKQGMTVGMLVTERHNDVKSFMRKAHPSVKHRFDVWHVAKGIRRKIHAASLAKKHQVLQKWCPSILNHLYWCARTSNDNGELVLAKWLTILRHVIDIHEHQGLHARCAHGDIGERLWLHGGNLQYFKEAGIAKHSCIPRLQRQKRSKNWRG
ncbi:uncharacterized protein LOC135383732 [Ornithodoros turicata]|uniref:uncharacterized protein LOC135383732 n=1 Tax=Ornithodoros turicata TaxID=34597 RepID=UPI0031392293